tara:strand:+ start:2479 stop:4095 length:1617 start_codon:yes stop_codon:yes gene_type:complete
MNKKVVFIADFFVEQVLGGGELNDDLLIKLLQKNDKEVSSIRTTQINLEFLKEHQGDFFIISNFIGLSEECKRWLTHNAAYIIYEHDHKYLSNRNPAQYAHFKPPQKDLRNFYFYKNAVGVICQSTFHKNILVQNLGLDNIISVGGNLWSAESLAKLKSLAATKKREACSIMDSPIPHKNTHKAVAYCKSKGNQYELVADNDYFSFLEKMGKNETLVFFPSTPETLSRLVCEARMMGMSVVTNGLVGAAKEEWFNKKGADLIIYMEQKKEEIVKIILSLMEKRPQTCKPKISIISTFHDADAFLVGFLKNMVEQTIFKDCELILVDADSQGNEKDLIASYQEKYPNIKYIRTQKLKPTPCLNKAIKEATGQYLTLAFIDDRKSKTCIEELYNALHGTSSIDLVYGDVSLSYISNETFEQSVHKEKFEHSQLPFSRENMVKCLPGPMPLWRKMVHDKCGFFDEDSCDFADDWEMWLRMVHAGSAFRKLDKTVGLYLVGGRSQQKGNDAQRQEEAKIFFKYSHIFGYNFNKYSDYFRQFL